MNKTKIALALLMAGLAFSDGAAAKPKKHAKAAAAKSAAKPAAKPAAPAVAERRQDKAFDALSVQFLTALWKIDPESAILSGKFDTAATMTVPDAAQRAKYLAFLGDWRGKFGAINAADLSTRQRTDLALLLNKLDSDKWYLDTFKSWE
jgi:hypothetical protein